MGDRTKVLSPVFVFQRKIMNTVTVEVSFTVDSKNGNISFPSTNLLDVAENLIKEKVVQCDMCGTYFLRGRGNPKHCDICRQKRGEQIWQYKMF